jgi:hypothetical protein
MLIFGTTTFAHVHAVLSLVGIGSGLVALFGMLAGKRLEGWTKLFLATTVLTSVTGFGFPFVHLLPSHKVGIISLIVLAVAIFARYSRHLAGPWRWIYAISAVLALYLNVFVLIVQLFRKVPTLLLSAPTQTEPPFVLTQLVVLVVFVALGIVTALRFRPQPVTAYNPTAP